MSGKLAADDTTDGAMVPAHVFVAGAVVDGSFVPHRIRGLFDTLNVSALIHFVGDQ